MYSHVVSLVGVIDSVFPTAHVTTAFSKEFGGPKCPFAMVLFSMSVDVSVINQNNFVLSMYLMVSKR